MNNKIKHRLGMILTIFGVSIPFIILMLYSTINFKLAIILLIVTQFCTVVGMSLISRGLDIENIVLKREIKRLKGE